MITCKLIREWIKTKEPKFDKYYVGKLDNKYQKAICIYSLQSQKGRSIAIGGKETTKTKMNKFTVLIHYDKNYVNTEDYSQLLYNTLSDASNEAIEDYIIDFIEMNSDTPIDLHTDENGVYERSIDFTVYYHNK
jgi:hypothetical protein